MAPLGFALIVSAMAAGGCGGCEGSGGDTGNDARLLISRLAALEALEEGRFRRRGQLVDDLRTLPVRGEELTSVRDHCVGLYGGLLDAEVATARARRVPVPAEDAPQAEQARAARAMEAALQESQAAIDRVQSHQSACIDGAAALRARYASGRGTSP